MITCNCPQKISRSLTIIKECTEKKLLGEINEMIVWGAKERRKKEAKSNDNDDSDDHSGSGGNSGTMLVDATCAPSNIQCPQDVSLLNEARKNGKKLLDVLRDSADGKKPRTYRKRARMDCLKYTRRRKNDPQSHWKAAVLYPA